MLVGGLVAISSLTVFFTLFKSENGWHGQWKCLEWEYGIKEDDWRTQRIGYCRLSDSNLDLICPLNKNYPQYFKCIEKVWIERRVKE
ncbi:MAG: hypothetical protein ACTSYD_02175 [Candidatus Heimdallarchaeaceae archaeon]